MHKLKICYKSFLAHYIHIHFTYVCSLHTIGSYILLWRRGTSVLTAASLMVTRDNRFKLVDGYNLQISNVRIQDAGDYVCQIGDQDARDQVHTVEIMVPPSVRPVPQNGQITARKGSTVILECKASGNPVPQVSFYKKVNLFVLYQHNRV